MPSIFRRPIRRRGAIFVLGLIVLIWVLFLDSHSVLNRIRWHYEADRLRVENLKTEAAIQQAKEELGRRNDEQEIERIARESYGMRREGETVYRVEEEGN